MLEPCIAMHGGGGNIIRKYQLLSLSIFHRLIDTLLRDGVCCGLECDMMQLCPFYLFPDSPSSEHWKWDEELEFYGP